MVKTIFLIFISLFILACSSQNPFPDFKEKKEKKEKKSNQKIVKNHPLAKKVSTPKPQIKNNFTLLVETTPKNSRVRIMNIKPKYKDNISLKKGKYLIEVSKRGFITYKKWIKLNSDTTLHVKLKKLRTPIFKYSGNVEWKREKLEDYLKKYSTITLMDSMKSLVSKRVWLDNKISKIKGIKWEKANSYCKNLKLYNLSWRLPTCKEAKKYTKKIKKYLLYPTDISLWSNKREYLSDKYGNCLYYNKNPQEIQFTCISKNRTDINYPIPKIASLITKDYKILPKNRALSKAINIKYGNPQIIDIKYNSKNETLSFYLISSRVKKIVLNQKTLKNSMTKRNSKRAREYIKVYNLKNESIISYDADYVYRSQFKAFDFSKIKNFKYLMYRNYIFDSSLHYASLPIDTRKDKIYIIIDKITTNSYKLGNFLRLSNNKSNYARGEVKLYIDSTITTKEESKKEYYFKQKVELKVSPSYIKEMINLITSDEFQPTVIFKYKNGKLRFKEIKELKKRDIFVERVEFKKAYYNIVALKRFIKKYPNSKFKKLAKIRIKKVKKLYKGYEPKDIFKVEGCVGYLPTKLITKNIKKLHINPATIKPSFFRDIRWSGLCRKGLLSGRGVLNMKSKDGNFFVQIKGKMENGFFTGEIKREIKKITKRISKSMYRYKYDKTKEHISLDSYDDYADYQRRYK